MEGRGKRGGARVIHFFHNAEIPLFLLTAFAKNEKANLSQEERNELGKLTKVLVESYQPYFDALAALTEFPSSPDVEDNGEPIAETDFSPTFREQLVRARRGQGLFRASVLLCKTECRMTRVSDLKHLRARRRSRESCYHAPSLTPSIEGDSHWRHQVGRDSLNGLLHARRSARDAGRHVE